MTRRQDRLLIFSSCSMSMISMGICIKWTKIITTWTAIDSARISINSPWQSTTHFPITSSMMNKKIVVWFRIASHIHSKCKYMTTITAIMEDKIIIKINTKTLINNSIIPITITLSNLINTQLRRMDFPSIRSLLSRSASCSIFMSRI